MKNNNIILITGATGFLGSALVHRLATDSPKNRQVITVRKIDKLWPDQVMPVIVGDLERDTDFSTALSGIQRVVHCAARVHVMAETAEDPLSEFRRVNVDGTLNLARQAAAAGVKRFVFVSSVKVNGEKTFTGQAFSETDLPAPQDAYGQSKYDAELGLRQVAIDTGMEVVIIRPPLIYGPGVKANFAALMSAVNSGWPLPLGAVNNKRSLVSLDNLVDFVTTCLCHPAAANQTFLVSDGHDVSTSELVRGIAQAAGVPARLLPVPLWFLRGVAGALGKSETVQRVCENLQVDITKAKQRLGWVPPVSLHDGLKRAING
jgi:nucleoside-diphosphate-sugar epimerase